MFVTPPDHAELGDIDPKYGEIIPAPPWMGWAKTAFRNVLDANAKVHGKFMQRVAGAQSSNNNIVVDMTNMNSGARKQALKAVEGGDYEKIAVVFEFEGGEDFIKKVALKKSRNSQKNGQEQNHSSRSI